MGTNVSLTPALEGFARELVEDGRYNNVSEVVREGLRLLQDRETKRRTIMALIREAEEDVALNGTVEFDQVRAEMDANIQSKKVARSKRA
jgi:antitoxin ParD1/3/4